MIDPVQLARTLHGHLGLLAAVALLHPALLLPDAAPLRRGTRWSTALATALLTATVAAGFGLYPGYRAHDKPLLLIEAFPVAQLFETKEHLAFYALALGWSGCALAFHGHDARARRLARRCFGLAAALAFTVGLLGSVVASVSLPR